MSERTKLKGADALKNTNGLNDDYGDVDGDDTQDGPLTMAERIAQEEEFMAQ